MVGVWWTVILFDGEKLRSEFEGEFYQRDGRDIDKSPDSPGYI